MSKFRESEAVCWQMLIKIGALKNFTNHTGKTPMLESPLNKTASPQACSFIKKRLQHRRPPAKLAIPPRTSHFYRTPPMMVTSGERQNMTLV